MKTNYIFENKIEIVNSTPYDTDEKYDSVDLNLIKEINKSIGVSLEEEGEVGLAKYPPDGIDKSILLSIKPKVVLFGNEPYCRCEVVTSRELTNEEIEIIEDDLLGQYSDGWGECFEQNAIYSFDMTYEEDEYNEDDDEYYTETYDFVSDVYVKFWLEKQENSFNIYKINSIGEDELIKGELDIPNKKNKIRVKLIGEDGNIFNLTGIASRALQRAGFHDEAKNLKQEVSNSKSYDDALRIIMNYVIVY